VLFIFIRKISQDVPLPTQENLKKTDSNLTVNQDVMNELQEEVRKELEDENLLSEALMVQDNGKAEAFANQLPQDHEGIQPCSSTERINLALKNFDSNRWKIIENPRNLIQNEFVTETILSVIQ